MNSESTLERCLESVFSQVSASYELIIKDGGSTDRTIEIIRKYESKISFFNTSKDFGVYDAFNYCMKKITGDWFIFLGSDDYLIGSTFLNEVNSHLKAANEINNLLVYGRNAIIDFSGIRKNDIGEPWIDAKKRINSVMSIRHPGCFHHRSLIEKVGYFDTKFNIAADHHYILRCLKFTTPYFYNFIGVVHQNGGLSTDPAHSYSLIIQTYLIRKDLNKVPFLYIDSHLVKRLVISILFRVFGRSGTGFFLFIFNVLKKSN